MNNNIFNVFLCGTGETKQVNQHHFVTGALVNYISRAGQRNFCDYVVKDGVGGEGDLNTDPMTPRPDMLGPKLGGYLLGEGTDNIINSVCDLILGKVEPQRLPGMLFPIIKQPKHKHEMVSLHDDGAGVTSALKQETANHHHLTLEQQEQLETLIYAIRLKKINQINLIGWSRGATTAVMIAHELHKMGIAIPVNILAFDPVPGLNDYNSRTETLSPNVTNYVAVLAMDEFRVGFIPVLPRAYSHATRMKVVSAPGNHDTLVGYRDCQGTDPLAARILDFAWETLRSWGLPEVPMSNPKEEALQWAEVRSNIVQYRTQEPQTFSKIPHDVLNWKEIGQTRYRLMDDGGQGYHYACHFPDLKINPADPWDSSFGIQSDTCTLHRDYNDQKIIHEMSRLLSDTANTLDKHDCESLASLITYLNKRAQTRDSEVFKLTLTRLNAYANTRLSANPTAKGVVFLGACLDSREVLTAASDSGVDSPDEQGETALEIAARLGNKIAVSTLLSRRANLTHRNLKNQTALMVAAEAGQLHVVDLLLKFYTLDQRLDALMEAAHFEQGLVVRSLLNSSFPPLMAMALHPELPHLLKHTIESNDLELFKKLITHTHILGRFTEKKEGISLVNYAEKFNRTEMVNKLTASVQNSAIAPQNSSSATAKPFWTVGRGLTLGGALLTLSYSSTVLACSVSQPIMPSLASTLLIASSTFTPVGVAAIIALAVAVILAGTLIGASYEHHKTAKRVGPA